MYHVITNLAGQRPAVDVLEAVDLLELHSVHVDVYCAAPCLMVWTLTLLLSIRVDTLTVRQSVYGDLQLAVAAPHPSMSSENTGWALACSGHGCVVVNSFSQDVLQKVGRGSGLS